MARVGQQLGQGRGRCTWRPWAPRSGRAGVTAVAVLLAGCSTVNPYQRHEALDNDLKVLKDQAYAGGLGDALFDINSQRLAWFESLSTHAKVANGASLAVYGLSAWGLYQGLKPGFVANGVASESTRANLAKAGIGAGLAYSIGNLFLNDKHDEAYVEGFRALTCVMARARPYLLKSDELADLQKQANSLETAIKDADTAALKLRWNDGVQVGKRANAGAASEALQRSESAQQAARQTLERARMLVSRVETVGFQLRRQGDLVVTSVSEELRRNNKGVANPEEFLTKLQAVTGRFQAIAPVDTPDDGSDNDPADAPPTTPAVEPVAGVAAGVGATTGAPAPSPSDKAASAAAATDKALVALATQLEALKSALLKPEGRKDQAFKQLDEQTQKLKKQLDAAEADIRKLKQAEPPAKPPPLVVAAERRVELATQVAGLYAQRRQVNQYLVNHNDLANRVKNIPECRSGGRPVMTVLPGEDRSVSPGTYRFVISGAKGVPLVSVDGNAGAKPADQRTLTVGIEGATVVVDLVIKADAPAGALRLLVHDPVSRATEDVVLTVLPGKKP